MNSNIKFSKLNNCWLLIFSNLQVIIKCSEILLANFSFIQLKKKILNFNFECLY